MLKNDVINYLKSLNENELHDILTEVITDYTAIAPSCWIDENITSSKQYDVILTSVGNNRLKIMKLIRDITGLGLKDVKNLINNIPVTIRTWCDENCAFELQTKFKDVGATVELKLLNEDE